MRPLTRRRVLFGAGAVLILTGVSFLAHHWQSTFPTVPALRVTRDLPTGVPVPPEEVTVVQVPAGSVPEGALTRAEQAGGKWTRMPVLAGEFLTARRLGDRPPDPATDIGNGTGLLSVPVNPAHVLGGNLRPGDTVTIYAVPRPEREGAAARAVAAAERVTVVEIRNASAAPTQAGRESGGMGGLNSTTGQVPAWVVVRVTAAEAQRLMEAVESKAAVYFFLIARGAAS